MFVCVKCNQGFIGSGFKVDKDKAECKQCHDPSSNEAATQYPRKNARGPISKYPTDTRKTLVKVSDSDRQKILEQFDSFQEFINYSVRNYKKKYCE